MLKIAKLTVALAIAGLAIPAFAQWPKGPSQRVNTPTATAPAVRAAQPQSVDGFVYAGAEESGYQVEQYRYFRNEENERLATWRQPASTVKGNAPALATGAVSGFTYRGDGIGWEVAPHKYVFSAGGLAMSNECDHAVRIVKGPTPAEIDSGRVLSPGA